MLRPLPAQPYVFANWKRARVNIDYHSQGFRSLHGARRTIQGYEVVHMIRKGQVRWSPKGDVLGLILFLNELLGLDAE